MYTVIIQFLLYKDQHTHRDAFSSFQKNIRFSLTYMTAYSQNTKHEAYTLVHATACADMLIMAGWNLTEPCI